MIWAIFYVLWDIIVKIKAEIKETEIILMYWPS